MSTIQDWLDFEIAGRIVPYVRMTQRSKYVSKKAMRYLAWKESFGWELKRIMQEHDWKMFPKGMPISVRIVFGLPWLRKPKWDLDNAIKAILDSAQGIVFKNDMDVEQIAASRVWETDIFGVTLQVVYDYGSYANNDL